MMAAYSDQVRSVDHELPILGSPDVRLHLPKHYALASWVTPEGRQPTFIAQTFPVAVDPERIAWHHRRQHERGGRELESFRQPHWDRDGRPGRGPARCRARAGPCPRRRDPLPWSRDPPLRPDR